MRDIVVHEYFGINKDIIWDVIQNKIPELERHKEEVISENKTVNKSLTKYIRS